MTNPPSLHRYLYAFQNPTIFVDPSGRAAQARNLAELQEHLADNPEELKALVARFVGEDAAEQVDLPFLAAVLQRTAGGTRLLNLIEDLGLAGSAKPEDFSGEDLAAVRTTLQELITLMDDLEGTVELIMESPREAGAEVVKLLRHQGRKGLELLIAAARGDEAAVFKLERFRRGLLIDATLAAAGGILGEAGGAGSAASGGRRCLDDLFGVFRKLRQRKGIDLRPTKSLRVKTGPGAGTSGGSSGARAVVSEETASVPRGHTEFATPGRFEGVGELSRILREAGVPRSDRLQVINSFRNGQIMLRRATGSENVLRFFGGDARSRGRFVTEGFPQGDARTLLALPPENAATGLTQFKDRFLAKAEEVMSDIQTELLKSQLSPGKRPTQEQLEVVLRRVEAMKRQIEEGLAPPKEARYRRLGRLLVDEWPLGHSLAIEISKLEDLFLRL